MGRKHRWSQHLSIARKGSPFARNEVFYSYLAKCLARGIALKPYVIASNMTSVEAAAMEVALIEHYGRTELGSGCLLNIDPGGLSGFDRAPSTVEKLADHFRKPEMREGSRSRATKEWHAAGGRACIAKRREAGLPLVPLETCRAGGLAVADLTRSPERRAAMSAAHLGKPKSAETRARMSKGSRDKWTPEMHERHSASMRAAWARRRPNG